MNIWCKRFILVPILTSLLEFSGTGNSAAAPATNLGLLTQPSGAVTGVGLVVQPVVQALDSLGLVDIFFTGNVSVGVTSGTATLTGTTTVPAVGGVATFTNLALTGSDGANTLTFTSSGLTSVAATSISLTGTASVQLEIATFQSNSTSLNVLVPVGRKLDSIVSSGKGTVVILDGKISYTPSLGFKGVDSFVYSYLDSFGLSKSASIQVTVPNQAPTINPVVSQVLLSGNVSVNLNARDPNGDSLKVLIGVATKDIRVLQVGGSIEFVVPKDFSGKISVPITVTDSDGAVTVSTSQVVIRPYDISKSRLVVTAPLKDVALNQKVTLQQKLFVTLPLNAIGYELYVNGKLSAIGNSSEFLLENLVGPRDLVEVVAMGNDSTRSDAARVTFTKNSISVANVNFAFDSSQLTSEARQLLKSIAKVVIQHGFTKIDLTGFVDSVGSRNYGAKLSTARGKIVEKYLAQQLIGNVVTIRSIGLSALNAVGDNKTDSGRALNRRVEIKVS